MDFEEQFGILIFLLGPRNEEVIRVRKHDEKKNVVKICFFVNFYKVRTRKSWSWSQETQTQKIKVGCALEWPLQNKKSSMIICQKYEYGVWVELQFSCSTKQRGP